MKKGILIGLILIMAISTIAMAANVCLVSSNVIKIGAENVRFYNEIYNINDKIYVPIRDLAEEMKIPIEWNEEKNQVELLTDFKAISVSDNTQINEMGVIPDEETAYAVGKVILEKYVGRTLEYETEKGIYFLKVTYNRLDNSWSVSQECKYKIGGGGGTGVYSPTVVLNKNTGEVTFINTYSVFGE